MKTLATERPQNITLVSGLDGLLIPNLRGSIDPRHAIADAETIQGEDTSRKEHRFLIFGRDAAKRMASEGFESKWPRVLLIRLDQENTKTQELEKVLGVVQSIKGRHEYVGRGPSTSAS